MTAPSTTDPELGSLHTWLEADIATRREVVESLPGRIRNLDVSLQAWVVVAPQPQSAGGPLAGIPFGVKDIIETEGLPTEFGSALYKGRRGNGDAAIVRELR